MRLAVDRDRSFGHAFQQAGLRPGSRPVDFVGQDHIAEDRPGNETESAGGFIIDIGSGDVRRQHIRRELDPAVFRLNRFGQGLRQQTFADAGSVFQQQMSVRQQTDDQIADDFLIAFEHDGDIFLQIADHLPEIVEIKAFLGKVGPAGTGLAMGRDAGIIEHDDDTADLNGIQMFEHLAGHRLGVDKGTVGAGKVFDEDPVRLVAQHCMMSGNVPVRNNDVAIRFTSQDRTVMTQDKFTGLTVAFLNGQVRTVMPAGVFLFIHSDSSGNRGNSVFMLLLRHRHLRCSCIRCRFHQTSCGGLCGRWPGREPHPERRCLFPPLRKDCC